MKKTIYTYKSDGYDFGEEAPNCEYCGASAEDTEIAETNVCGGFMCGDIECWNNYIWAEIWGRMVEREEKVIEVCDGCQEEEDTSYDGFCFECWEDFNELTESEDNDEK